MRRKRIFLYGTVLFTCVFLFVSFFFSTDIVDSAHGTENRSKTTTESVEKQMDRDFSKDSKFIEFYEKIEHVLENSSSNFNGEVGITYTDLSTGKQLSVNGTKEFYSASTIKLPLAMMIADKVQAGELSWDEERLYNSQADYEEGTGIIINTIQPSYSLRTLQEYNIVYSDNIAKNMLYDTFGDSLRAKKAIYDHFFQKETDWDDAKLTSEDAAKILLILYEEKKTNTDYQTIYNYMKQTVFHERMETPITSGKVAHKIGSYDGNLHDIGILETANPFILTIFTNGQTKDGLSFISSVTDQLWTIQQNDYPNE